MTRLKTNIIRIGNSQGIRLPKTVLQQCGLKDEVELEIESDQIIIKSVKNPRQGWAEAFQKMSKKQDDTLIDVEVQNEWDKKEWVW